jgi:transaldolase
MHEEWLNLREDLLFKTSTYEFSKKMEYIRKSYNKEYIESPGDRRKEIISIISELTIDIQSYLKKWRLQSKEENYFVSDEEIQSQAEYNIALLNEWKAYDKVTYIKREVEIIKRSNLMNLSILADKGEINNRWGNDYTSGLAKAMRKGAVFATTNPPLIYNEIKQEEKYWSKLTANIRKKYSVISDIMMATIMTMEVVLKNCRVLRPIFEATDGKYGYLSFQVNPNNANNMEAMVQEAEFVYKQLEEELGGVPNVVFKLPGTSVSIEAARILTLKGIGVNITLGFSVDQHIAFSEVIESGNAPVSFLVMMSGRLDDPIAEELQKLGVDNSIETAKYASKAVTRKSYYELYKKRKYKKSAILVASIRGPWNIDAALTDGAIPVYISIFPDKAEEYDNAQKEIYPHMDEEIPVEAMENLKKSSIFRKAYGIDKMMPQDYDSFYPLVATLKSFTISYNDLIEYLKKWN